MRRLVRKNGADGPERAPAAAPTAVTPKEEALWLMDRLVPGTGVNTIAVAFRVGTALDPAAVAEAGRLLVRRHQVLRTAFEVREGRLLRQVLPAAEVAFGPEYAQVAEDGVDAELTALAAHSFAVTDRPLVRLKHLTAPGGDVVCVAAHHLVFDTISATVLFEELAAAYDASAAGRQPPAELLREVPVATTAEPTAQSVEFWRRSLAGYRADELDLWLGEADVPEPTLAGGHVERVLSAEAAGALARLQRELRAPEAVVLLAAYDLLLARHGAGPDIVVGTPVNIRGPQTARAVGYHVNVLPLRLPVDLAGSFRDLVARARTGYFDALAHADVPIDLMLPELPRTGGSWRTTAFRHLFNYVPGGGLSPFTIAGRETAGVSVENGTSKFDLEFVVAPGADALRVKGRYSTEVHTAAEVGQLLERYDALLVALGADPDRPVGEHPLRGAADTALIEAANRTGRTDVPPTVPVAVARHAALTPDAPAVLDGERTVTYRQLWNAAVATRDALRAHGVTPGEVVGLCARRGPDLVAAVFGIWLAGAAYLPIDPDHPDHRVADTLADSGTRTVLTGPGTTLPEGTAPDGRPRTAVPLVRAEDAPPADPSLPLDGVGAPGDRAYLIYTSGSTGRPKGTLVSHANLANLVAHFREELCLTPEHGGLWMTTFAFDMSVMDLFLPLFTGGRLVVAPDRARTDGRALVEVLRRHRVDVIQATPTTWRLVLDEAAGELAGCRLVCGGEPMPPALARRLLATGAELRNLYGPTETTVWSTGAVVESAERIGVGRPIRNTRVFVADPAGRELPIGLRGELCIAGAGVTLGYHGRPGLTAEKFREHPVYGRYYRTGDQARWNPDGTLELLGRADRQIKLRGNRIELGEVEAVLAEHPEAEGAAVVVVGDTSADGLLVAFVEVPRKPGEGPEETAESVRGIGERLWAHARDRLPRAAVPHDFVLLDELPKTVTEKVDYPRLARIAEERRAAAAGPGGPAAEGEGLLGTLVALWASLLSRSDLTADSNFFTSGGHSLLGAQLVQQIEERLGARLSLADVFTMPTPRELADHLRASGAERD
ncbi:amino acid adenylation domain-containing protein [Kitasatospora sp. NPDC004799]|uniref:non-ribosomal peptide synthetase n=1 Tax=Kitasatospora sp. NPDC004799 TaxID=3154460 RepID=UPI0033B02797